MELSLTFITTGLNTNQFHFRVFFLVFKWKILPQRSGTCREQGEIKYTALFEASQTDKHIIQQQVTNIHCNC